MIKYPKRYDDDFINTFKKVIDVINTKGESLLDDEFFAEWINKHYKPIFTGEWDNTKEYEGLSIVTYQGASYTSKKRVPVGIDINNEEYWTVTGNYNAQVEQYRQDVVNHTKGIVNVLSYYDYVENGDWNPAIQKAVDDLPKNYELYIPEGTYDVKVTNYEYISLKSNMTLRMEPNTILKAIGTDTGRSRVLDLFNIENVNVFFGQYEGERNRHIGDTGETGHGISVYQCKNVYIHKPKVYDCWGDGIYMGKDYEMGDNHCENVTIYEPEIDNCRRNGISVCDAVGKGITIIRPKITNINGTPPQAGIDIEPEGINTRLDRLSIIEPYTENCAGAGIEMYLRNIGGRGLSTNINIEKHHDVGSRHGVGLMALQDELSGDIVYNQPRYENNRLNGIYSTAYTLNAPKIKVIKPYIYNVNNDSTKAVGFGNGISIIRQANSDTAYTFGNILIENPTIIDDRNTKQMNHAVFVSDNKNQSIENIDEVYIIDPLEISGSTENDVYFRGRGVIDDKYNQMLRRDTYFEFNVSYSNYKKTLTNKGNTESVTNYRLSSSLTEKYPKITFLVESPNQAIRIYPPDGGIIKPYGTAGNYLQGSVQGSQITIVPMGNGEFFVENVVGEWTSPA